MSYIVSWLNATTGNVYLATTLLSLLPTVEAKGALTVALARGMPPFWAWLLSCSASSLVVPLIFLCFQPLFQKLSRTKVFSKLSETVQKTVQKRAKSVKINPNKKIKTFLSLFAFVAVPLPMTGVWTGACIATCVDIHPFWGMTAVIAGNFASGGLVLLLNLILGKKAPLLLLVLAIFILITVLTFAVGLFRKKNQSSDTLFPLHGITK